MAKLTHIREQLGSLIVHLQEYTLEHWSSPLQAYIGGANSTVGLSLHIGERERQSYLVKSHVLTRKVI